MKLAQTKNVSSWQSFVCLHLKLFDIDHPLTFEVSKLRPMPQFTWAILKYWLREDKLIRKENPEAICALSEQQRFEAGKPTELVRLKSKFNLRYVSYICRKATQPPNVEWLVEFLGGALNLRDIPFFFICRQASKEITNTAKKRVQI